MEQKVKMTKEILIIGSGLAGITASRMLIKNGYNVSLMSSDYITNDMSKKSNIPSARINNQFSEINEDFINRYHIKSKNFVVVGSNSLGGLSNVWGGGFILDEEYLEKQNKKNYHHKIMHNFTIDNSLSKKNKFRDYLITFSNNEIKFTIPNYFKRKNSDLNYSANDDLNELKKNRNFTFLSNHFVTKIKQNKNKSFDIYVDNSKNIINFQKIVLALGTIGSTKILLDYFNLYNYKIKLKHNPQIALLGFSKQKILNKKIKIEGDVLYTVKNDNKMLYSVGLLGTISEDIIDVICKKFFFVPSILIKFFFKIFKDRVFIGNCFLSNSFSETNLYLEKNGLKIEGAYKPNYYNFEHELKKKIKKTFSKFSFLTIFYRMPLGSDIHYTGTIDKNNHPNFELNEDYSLMKNENIYIIDGSVLYGNPIYPGFYIINNAIDFASRFSKINK